MPHAQEEDAEQLGDGMSDAPAPSARLLFMLDITTSMTDELEACKGAMRGLVSMCGEDLPDYADQLSFAVITFTESDNNGCHTSLFESTSVEAAMDYMNTIQLGRPPEQPHLSANGGDGPENHKVITWRRLAGSIYSMNAFVLDRNECA